MSITLESDAFGNGQPIPEKYSQDGANVSPPLRWTGAPVETREYVLIVDDPDAPRPEPWVHWVIYKIPGQFDSLSEGVPQSPRPSRPAGALQGTNTSGKAGYDGPAPPKGHGKHHYHFKLYALDTELNVQPGEDKQALLAAIDGHVLDQGELIGTYER